MKRYAIAGILLLISAFAFGRRPAVSVDPRFSAAVRDFSVDLFRRVVEDDKGKNVFLSPSSAAIALSMTYNGARGSTQKAMEQALKLRGMTINEVNAAANAWLKAVETPAPRVEISIGNSIWIRSGVPLQSQFTKQVESIYEARVSNLDFDKPDAARIINNWVKGATKGRIEEIAASPISRDKVLFLINALYFKGAWTSPFDPKQTRDAPFTLLNGATASVPTMNRVAEYELKSGAGYRAVRLPYGDGRFSMSIFIPAEGGTVYDLLARITPETWNSMMTGFSKGNVNLLMPKFTFKYDVTLNAPLKAMGMAEAFDGSRSGLSGMVEPAWLKSNRLYISEVKQKTFIEVNEEGAEAAASTSVGVSVVSMPPVFAVDRPFLTAIHDAATDTLLFLGIVVDPR